MAENIIRLEDISVAFDGEKILDNLNLYIRDKEFVTLLGPSGCGKTTTLRIIAGFQKQDSGNVFFAGENINDLPPYKRNVNTVFQKYALFPHLNVYENVAFGLNIKKVPKQQIKPLVEEMLSVVNLKGFGQRNIQSLSGGQQQRVAIARALINKPKVLLLDEPLGALDLKLRKEMQLELKSIQIKTGITFIYVTHDQEEALTMSDTVVVMNNGIIQQIGSPQDIYNEPKNAFVADFIGESNIIDGQMYEDDVVIVKGSSLPCVDPRPDNDVEVDVVIRPEDIEVVSPEKGLITGVVESCLFKGVHFEITVNSDSAECIWLIHSTKPAKVGDKIGMYVTPDNIHIMKKMYTTDVNAFETEIVSADIEAGLYTVEIAGKELEFPSEENFAEGDTVRINFPAETIGITSKDDGDLNGYIYSVIGKNDCYELIVEMDDGRRIVVHRQIDEQQGSEVGIILDMLKAEVSLIGRREAEK